MKSIILIPLAAILIAGCVPLQQYTEVKDENQQLLSDNNTVRSDNDALKVEINELSSDLKRYKLKAKSLSKDTAHLGRKYQQLQHRYDDLNSDYRTALQGLKSNTGGDSNNKKLLSFLQQLQEDLQAREDALMKAEQDLHNKKRSLEQAIAELEIAKEKMLAQNKQLSELEQILNEKDKAMQDLRKSINKALVGFSGDELQVHMKNGKVYVSLEEKLLFRSGSYTVNEQGTTALVKIARVLEQNKEIEIVVEGHTDNVPYNGSGELKDNWDLSVKRATSVVRIMLSNSQIEPNRISATGRSEYAPIMKGEHSIALQKNRRTEVILSPKLNEVINLLEKN